MELLIRHMNAKGEILIPKRIRRENGLNLNSDVGVLSTERGVTLIPIRKNLGDFAGLFASDTKVDIKKLSRLAEEAMYGV